jgi:RNA-directed DNA polymerase
MAASPILGRLNKERNDNWVFGNKQTGAYLLKFAWFKIERHVLIRGTASPDDPSLQGYWVNRTKRKSVELTPIEQRLARKQNYVCPLCGQSLFNEEELHIHHVQPQGKGGPNTDENRRLVHLYCHQQIHSGKGVTADAAGQPLLL